MVTGDRFTARTSPSSAMIWPTFICITQSEIFAIQAADACSLFLTSCLSRLAKSTRLRKNKTCMDVSQRPFTLALPVWNRDGIFIPIFGVVSAFG
jgi:hypothetical protein